MTIKKDDQVVVITGKDKGKKGKVLKVNPETNRVWVEGVNMQTKHAKAQGQQPAEIKHIEGSIDASNVMYVHKDKPTRIGFKIEKDKKVRFAKSTGDVID